MEIILIAVPFFFLLIAVELLTDKFRKTGYIKFNDMINSLNLGVMSRLTEVLKLLLPISAYIWIYHQWAIWHLPSTSIAVWLLAFVVYDLGYYWVHRLSHEMAVMWGSHVVHHSSEEYNLTTALRQTGTPAIFAWIIFLPMAFMGVPPEVMIAVGSLNLLYQFWVHTRHINKLPQWFESLLVTPSHHRVHHGLNPEYIDKNYGGVFIIWDKCFGTFAAEKPDVEIVYGVSDQLKSWDPIWANLKVYCNLFSDAWHTQNWRDKVKTFLMPPGWRAADIQQNFPREYADSRTLTKFDIELPIAMKTYLAVQFAMLIGMVFALLLMIETLSLVVSISLAIYAIFHNWVIGAMQENRPSIKWLEPIRLVSTGVVLALITPAAQQSVILASILLTATLNLLWFANIFRRLQKHETRNVTDACC